LAIAYSLERDCVKVLTIQPNRSVLCPPGAADRPRRAGATVAQLRGTPPQAGAVGRALLSALRAMMLTVCAAAVWIGILFLAAGSSAADPTLVHTASGPIQGAIENISAGWGAEAQQARTFKGIPFARVERWQPPLPVKPWQAVRPALSPGATCESSEQCLFINVVTPWPLPLPQPAAGDDGGLAVMLFIHGGCNKGGSGSQYQTEELVAAAKNVIVVTLNYR
jgi:hypothetical protein